MPGETILSGAPTKCPDCGKEFDKFEVLMSAAGYYIGTQCDCGPYSRESEYYDNEEDAQEALNTGIANWR